MNSGRKRLSLQEIFTYGFVTIRHQFRMLLSIALVSYLPSGVLLAYVQVQGEVQGEISPGLLLPAIVVVSVLSLMGVMGIAFMIETRVRGEVLTLGGIMERVLGRLAPALASMFLTLGICLPLFFMLIVPGVIAMVYLAFVPEIVALRNVAGLKALGYSYQLVKGSWWPVFVFHLVLIVAVFFAGEMINLIGSLVTSGAVHTYITVVIHQLLSAFYGVFSVIYFLSLDVEFQNGNER